MMKTALIAILLLCLSAPAFAEPATVIDDFGCIGFVPDLDGGSLGGVFTEESHAVSTKKGVTTLTCHFDHDVDLPHATGAKGFLCNTLFGLTENTRMLATPGGKAVLVCKIKQ